MGPQNRRVDTASLTDTQSSRNHSSVNWLSVMEKCTMHSKQSDKTLKKDTLQLKPLKNFNV